MALFSYKERAGLPLLQEAAQPVCRKLFWAHEDSSTRAAAPGVLQQLGPRSWPCWGQGGSTLAGTAA